MGGMDIHVDETDVVVEDNQNEVVVEQAEVVVEADQDFVQKERKKPMTYDESDEYLYDQKLQKKGYTLVKTIPKTSTSFVRLEVREEEVVDEEEELKKDEILKRLDTFNFENNLIAQRILELNAFLELKEKKDEQKKRKFEDLHSQKIKNQLARKKPKTPKSKAKLSSNDESLNEKQFQMPTLTKEEYRDQMKFFLLKRGFSGKQFGRMSIKTMEKHVEEIKLKDSIIRGEEAKFHEDIERAIRESKLQ